MARIASRSATVSGCVNGPQSRLGSMAPSVLRHWPSWTPSGLTTGTSATRNAARNSLARAESPVTSSMKAIRPTEPETSGGCWRPMTITQSSGADASKVNMRSARPPALVPNVSTAAPVRAARASLQAVSRSFPMISLLATQVVAGPACMRRTHSAAPGLPSHCASVARVQVTPSVLSRGRGRAVLVAITKRTVMSVGASARTRNANHGLGLMGSFSGVMVMR